MRRGRPKQNRPPVLDEIQIYGIQVFDAIKAGKSPERIAEKLKIRLSIPQKLKSEMIDAGYIVGDPYETPGTPVLREVLKLMRMQHDSRAMLNGNGTFDRAGLIEKIETKGTLKVSILRLHMPGRWNVKRIADFVSGNLGVHVGAPIMRNVLMQFEGPDIFWRIERENQEVRSGMPVRDESIYIDMPEFLAGAGSVGL